MNAIIIGANKGLGLCLVESFAKRGHHVFAGIYGKESSVNIERVMALYNSNIDLFEIDVSNELSVEKAAKQIKSNNIDCLIDCAGVLLSSDRKNTIYEINIEEFRKTLEINTIGIVNVIKHFLPLIRTDGKGVLFFITSEAGSVLHNGINFPAYSISKAAANKAVFILRATLGNKYKIYAVHPGRMNTDMGRETAEIEPEESAENIYSLIIGQKGITNNHGFINYKGETMDL